MDQLDDSKELPIGKTFRFLFWIIIVEYWWITLRLINDTVFVNSMDFFTCKQKSSNFY